jgi:hypothetical protein
MKRTLIVGLFACCLLTLQRPTLLLAQDTSSGKNQAPAEVPRWETYRGITSDIKVLRVWQIESPFKKAEFALAVVSDADFQKFVQDPSKLLKFLETHRVFPADQTIKEIAHWASLMSPAYAGGDPDYWLITIEHGHPCRATITSQPLNQ